MHVEIHSLEAIRHRLSANEGLLGCVIQGLDLSDVDNLLERTDLQGVAFLGCTLSPLLLAHALDCGAIIFPGLPELPFQPYRPHLYSPDELLAGYDLARPETIDQTVDARIYDWFKEHQVDFGPTGILSSLAQRLHDHAIDDALDDLLHHHEPAPRIVAIMGGHGMSRTEPAFADVVELGWRLARAGYTVASGGGPGAMEAAHVGAWMSAHSDTDRVAAVEVLAGAPSWRDPEWFRTALAVRERWPSTVRSLAIPTWFYGHEPTNLFASHVAKYFANSIREDGLLAIARHGVVYAPGSAGTIQEVFQDAAQNHYGTFADVSPMVFLGERFWTVDAPAPALLAKIAGDRQYSRMTHICDRPADALDYLQAHPPVPYQE